MSASGDARLWDALEASLGVDEFAESHRPGMENVGGVLHGRPQPHEVGFEWLAVTAGLAPQLRSRTSSSRIARQAGERGGAPPISAASAGANVGLPEAVQPALSTQAVVAVLTRMNHSPETMAQALQVALVLDGLLLALGLEGFSKRLRCLAFPYSPTAFPLEDANAPDDPTACPKVRFSGGQANRRWRP
jgi:hypothetical protein